MVVAGADGNGWEEREEGWEEGRDTQLPKSLALALLTGRDLTQFSFKEIFKC